MGEDQVKIIPDPVIPKGRVITEKGTHQDKNRRPKKAGIRKMSRRAVQRRYPEKGISPEPFDPERSLTVNKERSFME
jgi:hypothetical protein